MRFWPRVRIVGKDDCPYCPHCHPETARQRAFSPRDNRPARIVVVDRWGRRAIVKRRDGADGA